VSLDAAALVLPIIGVWRLRLRKVSPFEARAGNLVRVNLYFLGAAFFDILRNLGFAWAAYGTQASSGMLFAVMGLMAANLYYCPECNSILEAWNKLKHKPSLVFYESMAFAWIALNVILPEAYVPFTIMILIVGLVYPTTLFLAARKRAKPPHVKKTLAAFALTWSVFVAAGTLLFALGSEPPALPVSVPYAWNLAFITGSVMFFIMSLMEAAPLGSVRFPSRQLIPETIVKPGHRYLILHDSGKRAMSFLSITLKGLVESGARVIVSASTSSWLLGNLSRNEPHFNEWKQNNRLVISENQSDPVLTQERLLERLSFGPISTVYLKEIDRQDLQERISPMDQAGGETRQQPAELFLLESSKAPRPQLTEFLHNNSDFELLNLSESTDPFSSLINLDHQKIRGTVALLEYDSNADYEGAVDKFLAEGMSNAELCVLFTTKSSALYRLIKGKKMVRIIAASSLLSAPDELPDGEMQIPDKELGLVASIASDFLDNSKNSGASFVFDSITDLIRGERWEQIYSGIRQLIDLLTVPNATVLFLANANTMDPRFLGALRGAFALQLRMDGTGLRAVKIPQK
jgi:hypothetical protein